MLYFGGPSVALRGGASTPLPLRAFCSYNAASGALEDIINFFVGSIFQSRLWGFSRFPTRYHAAAPRSERIIRTPARRDKPWRGSYCHLPTCCLSQSQLSTASQLHLSPLSTHRSEGERVLVLAVLRRDGRALARAGERRGGLEGAPNAPRRPEGHVTGHVHAVAHVA